MKTLQQPNRQIATRRVVLANPKQGEANRALVQQALGRPLQAKLIVGSPVDACEREADAVADRVVANNAARIAPGEALQRKCRACDEDEALRRTPRRDDGAGDRQRGTAPGRSAALQRWKGSSWSRSSRATSSGYAHTRAPTRRRPRAVNARAYTVGHDIVLGAGEGDFTRLSGRHLLAHELAHVVQQGGACADGIPRRRYLPAAPATPSTATGAAPYSAYSAPAERSCSVKTCRGRRPSASSPITSIRSAQPTSLPGCARVTAAFPRWK